MQIDDSTIRKLLSRDFTNAVIRIGLIAFLVVMCVRVFAPFVSLVLWAPNCWLSATMFRPE